MVLILARIWLPPDHEPFLLGLVYVICLDPSVQGVRQTVSVLYNGEAIGKSYLWSMVYRFFRLHNRSVLGLRLVLSTSLWFLTESLSQKLERFQL